MKKLGSLVEGIELISVNCKLDTVITGISYDSRMVKPGHLYAASREFPADRHDFIRDALSHGAAAILCERIPEFDCPYILAANTRTAMARISAAFWGNPGKQLRLIGVTGTNGKTTVTTLLKEVIERISGRSTGLIGTVHNMIGHEIFKTEHTTPEAPELHELFARMSGAGCEYVVMEVSSHSLALSRVEGLEYEVGALTNFTQDHLDFHRSFDNYFDAKAKLFNISKHGMINTDSNCFERFTAHAACPVTTFGIVNNADITAEQIKLHGNGVNFNAVTCGENAGITLKIPGMFSVYNALTVIGCSLALGFPLDETALALSDCGGVKGRVEVVPTGELDFTVLIDYAHTPDAIENVLKTVRGFAVGRVVILFGCGGDRDKSKRPLMAQKSAALADFVVITSDNPRTEDPLEIIDDILTGMQGSETPYTVIPDRHSAIRWVIENALPSDVIILTGKGHEDYQIIGKTKYHMDEREIAAEVIKSMQ